MTHGAIESRVKFGQPVLDCTPLTVRLRRSVLFAIIIGSFGAPTGKQSEFLTDSSSFSSSVASHLVFTFYSCVAHLHRLCRFVCFRLDRQLPPHPYLRCPYVPVPSVSNGAQPCPTKQVIFE